MKMSSKMMLLLVAFGLTACGSKYPPPDSQISLANSAISKAESAGAYEAAPVELKAAREKINEAKRLMQLEDNLSAQRVAEQAIVDANLAEAKARTAKSHKAVNEVKESIRTLQEEIDRKSVR